MNLGEQIKADILSIAQLLVRDAAPGWVAGVFFVVLFVSCIWTLAVYWRRVSAIRSLKKHIDRYADGQRFTQHFDELNAELQAWRIGPAPRSAVIEAWDEYAETTVVDTRDGQMIRRNAVRPTNFLNVEDLGFGPGFLRILPGMFVSLGLLFTFLGLVAALDQLGNDLGKGAKSDDVVIRLMTIASAKFIMSLAGLACSIIFGFWLRFCQGRLDKVLHGLCLTIERRLSFVSLEDLGFRQLEASIEQREAFRKIGMEMVADLKRPLDSLPAALSQSIVTAMEPVFQQVGQIGAQGMEGIVGGLASQISSSVGLALTRASDSLQDAAARIGSLVDRMNASSTQMGEGMQTALAQMASAIADLRTQVAATGEVASSTMTEGAERLLSVMNDTLDGIRSNTAEGAGAMSKAAAEMRDAAISFRDTLSTATAQSAADVEQRMREASSGAGQAMRDAFGKTSREIAQLGDDLSTTVGAQVIDRVQALATQFEALVGEVTSGVGGMRSASTSLRSGADAIAGAAVSFGGASREMVAATDPVRASHERIEAQIRQLAAATNDTAVTMTSSAQSVARSAAQVLEAAQAALGNEREGIRLTLETTRVVLAQLTRDAEKLDDIDAMLGRALSGYSAQLEAALGTAQEHIGRMKDTLAPGVDTLRGIVDRAETFMPKSGPPR